MSGGTTISKFSAGLLATILITAFTSCGDRPVVVQGAVVRIDSSAKTVVIRDECAPHRESVVSVANAEVGAEPLTDDIVRVAYRVDNGRLVAVRLMNLTRQEEIGAPAVSNSHNKCGTRG